MNDESSQGPPFSYEYNYRSTKVQHAQHDLAPSSSTLVFTRYDGMLSGIRNIHDPKESSTYQNPSICPWQHLGRDGLELNKIRVISGTFRSWAPVQLMQSRLTIWKIHEFWSLLSSFVDSLIHHKQLSSRPQKLPTSIPRLRFSSTRLEAILIASWTSVSTMEIPPFRFIVCCAESPGFLPTCRKLLDTRSLLQLVLTQRWGRIIWFKVILWFCYPISLSHAQLYKYQCWWKNLQNAFSWENQMMRHFKKKTSAQPQPQQRKKKKTCCDVADSCDTSSIFFVHNHFQLCVLPKPPQ